ncbi:MAG TPA: maleylacetoacetate isomerase [Polyangiaceae bacterium]|nr:maleylacetoacetate isomerase [Polyangiaceae bacterium]
MKLYSYYRSSSAWRVRIVLELKGVSYEYEAVNLAPDVSEQAKPGFEAVNPLRQIPTLEWRENDELVRLTQSVAISEYLDEVHPEPRLLPRPPLARARVRQLVEIVASGIQPLQNTSTLAAVSRLTTREEARAWGHAAIARGLPALESLILQSGGKYAVGDDVTLADAFIVPQLYNARRFEVDLRPFPRLVEVDARASALDAFVRAHPDSQSDSPTHAR